MFTTRHSPPLACRQTRTAMLVLAALTKFESRECSLRNPQHFGRARHLYDSLTINAAAAAAIDPICKIFESLC
jgi:hypothetical protein